MMHLIACCYIMDNDNFVNALNDTPCGYYYVERKIQNDNWIVKKR